MNKFDEMSNNQIMSEIQNMKVEYDGLKMKIINDLDRLDAMEIAFKLANETLIERLKGQKNE